MSPCAGIHQINGTSLNSTDSERTCDKGKENGGQSRQRSDQMIDCRRVCLHQSLIHIQYCFFYSCNSSLSLFNQTLITCSDGQLSCSKLQSVLLKHMLCNALFSKFTYTLWLFSFIIATQFTAIDHFVIVSFFLDDGNFGLLLQAHYKLDWILVSQAVIP